MQFDWREGNSTQLLTQERNACASIIDTLGQAQEQVWIEARLIADDAVGHTFCQTLTALAERGVKVQLHLDTRRVPQLSPNLSERLERSGVHLSFYRAPFYRPSARLHRRLIVIDQKYAFIGGGDFSLTHVQDPSHNVALELSGPIVADLQHLLATPMHRQKAGINSWLNRYPEARIPAQGSHTGSSRIRLVTEAAKGLENNLIRAIESAQTRISILTNHFCPPPELLSALLGAAERGVQLKLFIPHAVQNSFNRLQQSLLKHALKNAGGQLYSHTANDLGSNIILIDQDWVCFGSSNLDPQSLLRNLEADLLIRDYKLNQQLHRTLAQLPNSQCLSSQQALHQQGIGLSHLALDGLYYLRRYLVSLDKRLALASFNRRPNDPSRLPLA